MRRLAPLLVAVVAFSCIPSETPRETVRPFAKVHLGNALNRSLKHSPGAVLGARAGHAEGFEYGKGGGLWHSEFRADVTLPPEQTEEFLRELCRQIGLEVAQYSTHFDAGFPSEPGESNPNGYRDGRCDYYAARDGIRGWLNVPEPVREGDTLRLRIVTVES